MKIDQDLRAAIRSAEKQQKHRDSYRERNERTQAAITLLLKQKPAIARAITKASKERKRLLDLLSKQGEVIESFGLQECTYGDHPITLKDEPKFVKAGGVIPHHPEVWRYDAMITELAAADEKTATKILAKIGIRWQ